MEMRPLPNKPTLRIEKRVANVVDTGPVNKQCIYYTKNADWTKFILKIRNNFKIVNVLVFSEGSKEWFIIEILKTDS